MVTCFCLSHIIKLFHSRTVYINNYFIVSVDQNINALFTSSTILNGDIDLVQQLVQWVEDEKFGWQLCYRASDDGWKAEDFHEKCDDVGPTVTLVKCKNNIFGGYTDQSWKPPRQLFTAFGILRLFFYNQMATLYLMTLAKYIYKLAD